MHIDKIDANTTRRRRYKCLRQLEESRHGGYSQAKSERGESEQLAKSNIGRIEGQAERLAVLRQL